MNIMIILNDLSHHRQLCIHLLASKTKYPKTNGPFCCTAILLSDSLADEAHVTPVDARLIRAVEEKENKSLQLFAFHHIEWNASRRKSHTMPHWPADANGVNRRLSNNISIYSACQWHKHLAIWACQSPAHWWDFSWLLAIDWETTQSERGNTVSLNSLQMAMLRAMSCFRERERVCYLIGCCWPSNLSMNVKKNVMSALLFYKNLKKQSAPKRPPCARRGPEDTSALWHFG